MAKKKKDEPKVNINDKEYKVSDLTQEQVMLVNHVADLDNKLRNSQFNVEQLQGGHKHFMGLLDESLKNGDSKPN